MKIINKSKGIFAATLLMLTLASPAFAQIGNIETGPGWAEDIGGLISFALNFIMVVALLLVFFYLIWGGIQWITSGGDKGKTEEARNKITAAIIGIIILAAAYALVQFVAYILGFTSFEDAIQGVDPLNTTSGGGGSQQTAPANIGSGNTFSD